MPGIDSFRLFFLSTETNPHATKIDMKPFAASLAALLGVSFPVGAATVFVANHSFETTGTAGTPSHWSALPTGGAWTDGLGTNSFEIYNTATSTDPVPHFSVGAVPDGTKVLNLEATSPLTQNLSHPITAGDLITLTFYLGNSQAQADPAGDATAYFTLDGSDAFSQVVTNNAVDNQFLLKTVQWTATSAGNLGLKFTGPGKTWIDNVSVDVVAIPEPSGSLMLFTMAGFAILRRRRAR